MACLICSVVSLDNETGAGQMGSRISGVRLRDNESVAVKRIKAFSTRVEGGARPRPRRNSILNVVALYETLSR